MTTAKNELFIGLLHENYCLVGREWNFGEVEAYWGRFFLAGGE